jgi:HSP20 family protein
MALMRPLFEVRDQMERLFHEMEEFQLPSLSEIRERHPRTWVPAVDLSETDGQYELKMEVPGIKPEDLDVQIQEDSVIVRGEVRLEKLEEKKDIYRKECHYGSLYRRIPLPSAVKIEGAKAELKHGILDWKLPKAEGKPANRIPVQAK